MGSPQVDGTRRNGVTPVIETDNLTKFYGKSRGITGVNLRLERGEVFGFIGPNGAGKTTTIRLLLNFIFPTSGSAKVFGLDCVRDSKEIKRRVGYLPGEVAYYGDMRVRDLLDYSSRFYGKDCGARGKELASIMDLDLNKRIETLSLGNKKKVGVVQAMLHEPELFILDEPTSGLDPLMQRRFYDLLLEENRKGVTIFFSSHVLSEVQKLCNRVAILKEGSVLRVEEVESLRARQLKRVTPRGLWTRAWRVESLRARQLKRVHVTFKDPEETIPAGLSGISGVERDNGTVRFLFSGDVDSLIKGLAQVGVANLFLEEPPLEEIFMHYYEGGKQ